MSPDKPPRLTEAELDAQIRDMRAHSDEQLEPWSGAIDADDLECEPECCELTPLQQRITDGAIGFLLALVVVALLA